MGQTQARGDKVAAQPDINKRPRHVDANSNANRENTKASTSPKHNPAEFDFLELFGDEVRVLSGLANLETELLSGKVVAVDKDDLVCLLKQESQRLSEEVKKSLQCSHQSPKLFAEKADRRSATSTEDLRIITKLLLRLQNLETPSDNGAPLSPEDRRVNGPDPGFGDGPFNSQTLTRINTSQAEAKAANPGGSPEFSECVSKKKMIEEFLKDVETFKTNGDQEGSLSGQNADATTDFSDVEDKSTRALHHVPPPKSTVSHLRRNKMSLHLFGTSRLHEELKLQQNSIRKSLIEQQRQSQSPPSNRLPYYPVQYKFWAPIDETLFKCFNDQTDRRIISICRRSQCQIHLLAAVRKNANGIAVQQISVQAPSLGALERCCSILDDVFPRFNASISLRGHGTIMRSASESEIGKSGANAGDSAFRENCHRTATHRLPRSDDDHKGLINYIISQMDGQRAAEDF
uniref:P-loop containing nucleoside triphosphate hydrolase n=1 Tax=Mesocestoides corti TaxID=53468 RepID=A0A5K3FS02_MESCO